MKGCVDFRFGLVLLTSVVATAAPAVELFQPDPIPTVLTPTRLRQAIADVPASVTIITQEAIQRLQIRKIPEVLRLVPGMVVAQASGNEYRINYHGTNGLIPRRMQVLVDGMSVYRSGYAEVDWAQFPVAIEDIARIEVTRSPSASTYGANSFAAVVNIITVHPDDGLGTTVKVQAGSIGTKNAITQWGERFGSTAVRVTLAHQVDSGFDQNFVGDERRDGTRLNRINARTVTEINPTSTLDLQVGKTKGMLQNEFADAQQISFPDYQFDNHFLLAKWTKEFSEHHSLDLKGYVRETKEYRPWRSCYPTILLSNEMSAMHAANPQYAATIISGGSPSGGSAADDALAQAVLAKINQLGNQALQPMCGDINENNNEHQYDLELQDTFVYNDQLRLVSGMGIRKDTADSKTFPNGKVSIDSARVFTNLEYRFGQRAVLNLGGMWEKEESHIVGVAFSPRAALNVHLNKHHTLRFVYSKAIRTPDMLEFDRDWRYLATNLSPTFEGDTERYFYYSAKAAGDLLPEEIHAKEISYYANLPKYHLSWDLKLYEEKLDHLISEKLQLSDYQPSNNNQVRLRGVEFQVEYRPTAALSTYLTYAYIDNETTNFFEKSLHARHSGSAYASYDFGQGWQSALGYFGSSAVSGFSYDRYDWAVRKSVLASKHSTLDLGLKMEHYHTDSGFIVNERFSVRNLYDQDTHFFLSLDYSF